VTRSRKLFLLALLAAAPVAGCTRGASVSAETTSAAPARRVSVVHPARHDVARKIVVPANVVALEQATLLAQVPGYLKEIGVDKGDVVRAGDVLAVIDVPDIVAEVATLKASLARAEAEKSSAVVAKRRAAADVEQAAAEVERAMAAETLTASILERTRGLREDDAVAEQDLEVATAKRDEARQVTLVGRARRNALSAALEEAASRIEVAGANVEVARASLARAETQLDYATIRAPYDGVITERLVDRGAMIQTATTSPQAKPIVTIARVDRVRVQFQVAESEVSAIRKGIALSLETDAYPGHPFEGEVVRSAQALDPATRTMLVEAEFANKDRTLLPGMYGRAIVVLEKHPAALTVPAYAVVKVNDRPHVWVVDGGKAKLVPIQTGIDDGPEIEVVDGLAGAERLAVGVRGMADGTPVEAVEAKVAKGEQG
jgi:RND family efflux transporter MFP subunit